MSTTVGGIFWSHHGKTLFSPPSSLLHKSIIISPLWKFNYLMKTWADCDNKQWRNCADEQFYGFMTIYLSDSKRNSTSSSNARRQFICTCVCIHAWESERRAWRSHYSSNLRLQYSFFSILNRIFLFLYLARVLGSSMFLQIVEKKNHCAWKSAQYD